MEEFIEIVVDGHYIPVEPNISLLKLLNNRGFNIPFMCFHPQLKPYGACGLCLVETFKDDSWKVQHACLLIAKSGMEIRTRSEKILKLRGRAAGFLIKRGPFLKSDAETFLQSLIRESEEGRGEGAMRGGANSYQ